MDFDTTVGVALTGIAVAVIVGLFVWSSRIIDRIGKSKLTSLRQIRREMGNGRRSS